MGMTFSAYRISTPGVLVGCAVGLFGLDEADAVTSVTAVASGFTGGTITINNPHPNGSAVTIPTIEGDITFAPGKAIIFGITCPSGITPTTGKIIFTYNTLNLENLKISKPLKVTTDIEIE